MAPLEDSPQQSVARLQLLERLRSLHGGGHDGDVHSRRRHVVRRAHHAHIDVVAALHLSQITQQQQGVHHKSGQVRAGSVILERLG